ncbi:MAG: response regulator [Acidobacteria bacterium]|nr:response regulator [Acidobacteriota bacterium]
MAAFLQTPHAFDLVLVDQNMPGQTGIQMARQFRAIRPDLPIILLSGSLSETEVQEAQSAGIQSILDKPILLPQLARAVRDLLDR